jgi:hypothetical protein
LSLGPSRPLYDQQMPTTLTGTATFTRWIEDPPHDAHPPVPRLAHAVVDFAYSGDLEARSVCHYVMSYRADGVADFVGLEQVDGTLLGEAGGFVLEQRGTFGPAGLDVDWTVCPGTASGSLVGLTGSGGYAVAAGESEENGEHRWSWRLEIER